MTDQTTNAIDLRALPSLRTELSPAEVVSTLEGLAKRGKLAGFSRSSGRGLFTISDFGGPFESVLTAEAAEGSNGGTTLRFSTRFKPLMPLGFVAVLVVTVWPGVWFTDSLLRTYFTGYDYQTWMWYLPLTVPFLPLAWLAAVKRSRSAASGDLGEMLPKIAAALKGTLGNA